MSVILDHCPLLQGNAVVHAIVVPKEDLHKLILMQLKHPAGALYKVQFARHDNLLAVLRFFLKDSGIQIIVACTQGKNRRFYYKPDLRLNCDYNGVTQR
jgi:tRNA G18 (ribose-2'-O)-methylase SpoU